jgi:hypothetical protein
LPPWFFLMDVDVHTQLGAIRLGGCGLLSQAWNPR